jgi:hypothetical protein
MAQFSYDVIEQNGGWLIMIAPARLEAFPTRQSAFDTAVEFARKLRFMGFSVNIRMQHETDATAPGETKVRRAG